MKIVKFNKQIIKIFYNVVAVAVVLVVVVCYCCITLKTVYQSEFIKVVYRACVYIYIV